MIATKTRDFNPNKVTLAGQSVLVTGGTGSFGKAFVRTVLNEKAPPRRLLVFSRDEQKQEEMAREFPVSQYPMIRYFIGDVRDADRLELAMNGVDCVVHAAALKIVPTAEYNPFECIKTNVHGAENVVKASLRAKVKKVIALSTDKAANPVNLYGASKLAADKIFVAANNLAGEEGADFAIVRYGNVVGSRGSVVPFFYELVARGAQEVPITDPRMTRFWITLEQGVQFVLSSLAMMRGGEIFVPKIPSMKLVDLATTVAPGLQQKTVGIRPGEKLHEVMITEDDARSTLELDDRYVICPNFGSFDISGYTKAGGRQVAEEFRYASDTNSEWLDSMSLEGMLGAKGEAAVVRPGHGDRK